MLETILEKQKKEKQLLIGMGLASVLIAFSLILIILNYVKDI